jgi:glycosyltransferase involved in cell wall biosynthesis
MGERVMSGPLTALVFLPRPLLPLDWGHHKRTVSILSAFSAIGYRTHLAWLAPPQDDVAENRPSFADLGGIRIESINTLSASQFDSLSGRCIFAYRRLRGDTPYGKCRAHSPRISAWFRRLVDRLAPDVILTNNVAWTDLLPAEAESCRVIDCMDLSSVYEATVALVGRHFSAKMCQSLPPADHPVLSECFYDEIRYEADPEEYRALDRYDTTLAISSVEADLIRKNSFRTRVRHLPMAFDPVEVGNRYHGSALFPMNSHPLNQQGYAYFVRRVLPLVQRRAPGFRLRIIGRGAQDVPRFEGVEPWGYVPDVRVECACARFVVVPVLGGTGQMVRVAEAMAHGLAVVATASAARSSPIIDGENGFVAHSAESFADAVLHLWSDRSAAQRMGAAARDTIAQGYSHAHLQDRLRGALAIAKGGRRSDDEAARSPDAAGASRR